jgi:hypothetical protein
MGDISLRGQVERLWHLVVKLQHGKEKKVNLNPVD